MFLNDEFERIFKHMPHPFFETDDIFEDHKTRIVGPVLYGYTITTGPDGRPVIGEYSNTRSGSQQAAGIKEPAIDVIADEKQLKLVAEMPGVEKSDVKVIVQNKTVDISANHGDKKYQVEIPIQHKIDEDSAKASYRNGILELVFEIVASPKPEGKTVEVK